MDKATFEKVDPLMDEIAESTEEVLDSPALAQLRKLLVDLDTEFGSRYTVSLCVTVDVFDEKGDRSLPLAKTGLSGFNGDKPYHTTGDSTPRRGRPRCSQWSRPWSANPQQKRPAR